MNHSAAAPEFVEWKNPNKLFVYGTLKRGFHNHGIVQHCKFLGEATTKTASFTMYDLGAFPGVSIIGNDKIVGEVFELPDAATLARTDQLEGHPRFYQRMLVETTLGPCYTYIIPTVSAEKRDASVVKTGFWSKSLDMYSLG